MREEAPFSRQNIPATDCCEVEVIEGLEAIANDELLECVEKQQITHLTRHQGALQFDYNGDLAQLLFLNTVVAVHLLLRYPVSRPRALLGHEHLQRLLKAIQLVRQSRPSAAFRTFHLSAAGADSSVMSRLKQELAAAAGLDIGDKEGDLLIRIRRAKIGWDVLLRLSPRPLSTRDWRVRNFEGALNASVAHAMARLTSPRPENIFLNVGCGSGTLLIERLIHSPARQVIGCDIAPLTLDCARANVAAAGYTAAVDLIQADACYLPFPAWFADVICADLPFGQLVGSHQQNRELYPRLLAEVTRVAQREAQFIAITHEVRLMEQLLSESTTWQVENIQKITLRGLHPRIFRLRKIE